MRKNQMKKNQMSEENDEEEFSILCKRVSNEVNPLEDDFDIIFNSVLYHDAVLLDEFSREVITISDASLSDIYRDIEDDENE